ncbi:MAG: hypothetical protein ABI353_01465 [Isosphaeraceae bacterium]
MWSDPGQKPTGKGGRSLLHVVLLAAVATLAGNANRPPLARFGGDPARGVLVNVRPDARPDEPPDPARPTVVFVHGTNPVPKLVHFTMARRFAESLARRPGPSFNVLEWDWNAATSDSRSARVNHANALRQGGSLADALQAAGLSTPMIHLIGHSAGGMVAASAARTLSTRQGWPTAQLTFLDPADCYHEVIIGQLATGLLAQRVENYWCPGPSGFGKEMHHAGVRNVRVPCPTPYVGVIDPRRSGHLFLVQWYIATAGNASSPLGFGTSLLPGQALTSGR